MSTLMSLLLLLLSIFLLTVFSYFIFNPFARVLKSQYKLNRLADICRYDDLIWGKRDFLRSLSAEEVRRFQTDFQVSLLPVGDQVLCTWHDEEGRQHVLARGVSEERAVSNARFTLGQLGLKHRRLVQRLLAARASRVEILQQLMQRS
ncbi:hypothetical protein [Cardiobacterium valvarum]|uniref:Uncharacterized protein n=1 Tax=Cardiobacterium valvarum TaxID=194702 RepID=A0A381E7S1_9GAMM|nr:hypothetical protein [Cardiobacterium valvarum]SUX22772.1 Uncharacterised protein [Cardiobacterium valvarum]